MVKNFRLLFKFGKLGSILFLLLVVCSEKLIKMVKFELSLFAIQRILILSKHGQVEIHCAINLTILKQRSIKGNENLLMDDFTYIPTKSFIFF